MCFLCVPLYTVACVFVFVYVCVPPIKCVVLLFFMEPSPGQ